MGYRDIAMPEQNRAPRIYVSGRMTGLPELNFPAFNAEAARLRALGYEVVNPAELNPSEPCWKACMRKDIAALMDCDWIAMLPNWQMSRGATEEHRLAELVGIQVFTADSIESPWSAAA